MPRTFDEAIETPLEYWLGTHRVYTFTFADLTDVVAVTFMVKKRLSDPDDAAILDVAAVVSGQTIEVPIAAADTDTEIPPGLAHWVLKRTDAGAATVLRFGTISLRRSSGL